MIIEDRQRSNPIFNKVYSLWYNMNSRCHDENSQRYHHYGAKGIYVSERWRVFDNFVEDVDKIEGFNLDEYLAGKLALDKDIKVEGNKEYSLDKCQFVTLEENNKVKPSQQNPFVAINPEGVEIECVNQSETAKKYGLGQSKISECLRGKRRTHKGWTFRYI